MAEGLAVGAKVTLVIRLPSRLQCLCKTSMAMYINTNPKSMPSTIHFKSASFLVSRYWNKDMLAIVLSVLYGVEIQKNE